MKMTWKRTLALVALVGFALLPGCGGNDTNDVLQSVQQEMAKITAATEDYVADVTSQYNASFLSSQNLPPQLSSSLGGGAASLQDLLLQLKAGMDPYLVYYEVKTYQVTYTVPGYGEPLSGLVAVPVDTFNSSTLSLPMISLQHPTQVLRSQSPSVVSPFADEELTVPFGMLLAAMGYIVVMPDYPGMGDNLDIHPYCMTDLAKSVSGLIAAAAGGNQPWSSLAAWDGRLFLIGFSEGGYATLVTARDIQENHPEYNLVGVAALDGPYSLSETMRNVMLTADASFSAPYFLPYVVAAYGAAYGAQVPVMQFNSAVLGDPLPPDGPPLNDTLYPMLFGDYTGEEISNVMRQVSLYDGPGSILTDGYLADLADTQSALYLALQENDAFRGWTPQGATQVLLYHEAQDDLVPVGNFENVKNTWGTPSNVTYENPDGTFLPGLGSVHAGALIPAYIRGTAWIDALANL